MNELEQEIEFVNPPPYSYNCPVCFELLKEAYQTNCCGNHICSDCIKQLKCTPNIKCPQCRQENFKTHEDKFFSRQLLNLEVHCYYHKERCTWTGELRGLEQHVATNCKKGTAKCNYCDSQCGNKAAVKEHLSVCGDIPIDCPNKCPNSQCKRKDIQNHLEKVCPLRVVIPSKGSIPRAANKIIQTVPLSFTMTNYLHYLESGDPWFSPPFYTHRQGYQIHLRIDANLHKMGNVSVVACVLKGEYDHLLQWPLRAELEVDLFNWRDSDRSYTKTLYLSGDHFCNLMPTKKLAEWGKGDTYFIAHYELGYNPGKNSEYLLHNCLSFRVKRVTILANTVPDLPPWALGNCLSQFTITSFLQNKARNASFYGPPFYTNSRGYKLVVFANLNGFDTAKDTHVSLSVLLMKGEYDDSLIWPFSGDVVVTMLNWRQDKNHQERVISLSRGISNTSTDRVLTTNIAPTSWGIPQFISHSALSYKHSLNTEFLKNDCLLIKVKSVEVYSSYGIPKALSWKQHPHNTQTCCEFVLSHFTKRKELKSYYCSDPFFTHRNGYKMQIKVNANNSDHIGAYVYLMKSSNDDNLMWPFHGDVVVELLNCREDKRHHRMVIGLSPDVTNTTRNRVITGDRGSECWGYPHFISHSALGCNSSKNTQYLQDDCLHFRIKEVIVHSTVLTRRLPRWQNPQSVSPYLEFTVPNFSKVKELGTTYISPTLFTHHQGYKLRLEVKANKRNEIYYVSVYARLLKGDNDDNLVWPFRADVVIELLNWRQNVNHQKYTISFHERTPDRYTNRIMSGNKASDSWGTLQLIPYSNLTYNSKTNTEYLQNDCLRLIVKEIVVYSTPHCKKIPIWQSYQPTNYFEFTITRFSQRIRLETAYFSRPFYTSSRGHKMCLKVYPAGDGAGSKGTHVSVYGFLLKGEYDDSLSWPFHADVVSDILNWRGDHSHHRNVLQFHDDTWADARARVYDDNVLAPSGWGNSEVIELSTLFPRYASATQYLEDDCMRIRIYDVALYNTPLLNKTPQWQNSWNTSSSWPIEVTVTGFHKHKMYNTKHISPPFYTHKNGYKMRLEVHPNGSRDAKGTHLSIFARLLKGENDNNLKWPMNIDIALEVVNWRKNDSHIFQRVNFSHAQVTSSNGKGDSSWGKPKFCTHYTLFSKSRNIEYIQDDCIRVRVKGAVIHSRKGLF